MLELMHEGRAMNVIDLLNTGLGESMGAAGDLISLILIWRVSSNPI